LGEFGGIFSSISNSGLANLLAVGTAGTKDVPLESIHGTRVPTVEMESERVAQFRSGGRALTSVGYSDHPIVASGKALDHVFDTLPKGARLELVVEIGEIHNALNGCVDLLEKRFDRETYCTVRE
jgi:hypothetical protein